MEGRLVLRCEVSSTEAVQIIRSSDSIDGHASHFCTYPRFFPEVAIVLKVGQGMDLNPEDETSYTIQYKEAFLKQVENEYCAKHGHVRVNTHGSFPWNNGIHSAMASGSCQSSFDP